MGEPTFKRTMEAFHGILDIVIIHDTSHALKRWPYQRLIIPRPSCATCHLINEKNKAEIDQNFPKTIKAGAHPQNLPIL